MNKKKNSRIYLKQPTFDELWYRKKLLADPKTMEYNKGYESNAINYNYENGTIDFDEVQWDDFYKEWIVNNKNNFYAYIVRKYDKKFIGEIKFTQEERKAFTATKSLSSEDVETEEYTAEDIANKDDNDLFN